jgi:DNA polymerase III epsilon subunit-like protein
MKFIKDLLFFELITTGSDPDKDNILQLSAVLLDKDNLLERESFNSHVRVSFIEGLLWEHSKLLRIEIGELKKSPKIYDVIKQFRKKFPDPLLLATHSFQNTLFLKNAFKKAALPFDFDTHIVDVWTLGYIYTLNYGLKKMPTFHTFLEQFKLKQQNPNDALEKVRLEAEIFRKIIKEV